MSVSNKAFEGPRTERVDLRSALEERYLNYALSTIMHRALPDVRDGLKPVHRRLLNVMRLLKLYPDRNFKKSARVVGDVIGRFHPHGEQAIYDALVRLAQDFSMRYPLVEGQGNFGNIDGDNAAAMRYTEVRLTEFAMHLIDDIDEDTVDFRKTYDGDDEEPLVFPAAVPNLLTNGASGIAVGMATSIPTHNLSEVCDAALRLIEAPDTSTAELMEFLPGPDFPTGGVIVEPHEQLLAAYTVGRGSVRVRAHWEREDHDRDSYIIVIVELPYQVQKARLIKRIADLLQAKKLPLLSDVRDESSEDVRIVLEPKNRTVDPVLLMECLFKLTDLETRIPVNMNVLSQGRVPRVMGLVDLLKEWLAHRRNVLVKRSQFRLQRVERRIEVLEGYIVAFLNLDEVIRLIRDEEDPKSGLLERFGLTEIQAESILDMRLRSLRRLEEMAIREECAKHEKERKTLIDILDSQARQWTRIGKDIREIQKHFGALTLLGKRRTRFDRLPDIGDRSLAESMIEREPVTVVISEQGWCRSIKGHLDDLSYLSFKAEDGPRFIIKAQKTDEIILLSACGRFFVLPVSKLPDGRSHGEHLRLILDIEDDSEIAAISVAGTASRYLIISREAKGFIVNEKNVMASTRKGKQIFDLDPSDKALVFIPVDGDHIATVSENRKLLIFPVSEIPELSRGKGVYLQKLHGSSLSDGVCFDLHDGLTWHDSAGRVRNIPADRLQEWVGHRARSGRLVPRGFPQNNRFRHS